ncbi:hypothetical protein BDM02DRAFT_1981895 [Thelephora ganbajun]|uniref:Uncharacterized protein n=1 Tax=Thelephora ganbajun TaxID=370292 RepID=A0ACB6ZI94_THEGA|nr:hypothetical protein BDM02DRAFT_1981895 [Thelephora ganbajun]
MYATRGTITTVEEAESPALNAQNPDSYQHLSVQGPYHLLEGPLVAVPSPEHPLTSNASDIAQGYSRSFTAHPIPGMIAELEHDGTVVKVYGPPLESIALNGPDFALWWEDSRVAVPQHPYRCGTTQKNWGRKPSIYFLTRHSPGVRLFDALHGNLEMDDKDDFPFDACCTAITIRIHFTGYASSTNVEKILKGQGGSNGRETARSMRLSTKVLTGQITKGKLVKEVSKCVWWHISDLEKNGDLFPFDDRVDERWRLGQGRMKVEHMVITGLVNASYGSWSPIIYIE